MVHPWVLPCLLSNCSLVRSDVLSGKSLEGGNEDFTQAASVAPDTYAANLMLTEFCGGRERV